jgi:hypothetical protein
MEKLPIPLSISVLELVADTRIVVELTKVFDCPPYYLSSMLRSPVKFPNFQTTSTNMPFALLPSLSLQEWECLSIQRRKVRSKPQEGVLHSASWRSQIQKSGPAPIRNSPDVKPPTQYLTLSNYTSIDIAFIDIADLEAYLLHLAVRPSSDNNLETIEAAVT